MQDQPVQVPVPNRPPPVESAVPAASQTNGRWFDAVLLALALTLGGLLNWQSFVQDCLAIDEHVSFWIADRSSPSSLLVRSFRYSATPPLSFVLQRLSLDAFGSSEWALRLPAFASFLGAIIAVWWVGRRWLSPLAGGLAAVLLATHPVVQQFAVAGRPYSVGLLLGVLAMHCTWRVREMSMSRWWWPAWMLVNLALVQTHYLFAVLWTAQLVWLARPGGLRPRQLAVAVAGLFACALSVAPGILRLWEHRDFLNWTTHKPELIDLFRLAFPIRWSWSGSAVWWVVLAVALVWQFIARRATPQGEAEFRQRVIRSLLFAAIWIVVPAGGLWLLARLWLTSLAADRYLVIAVPGAVLVVAGVLGLMRSRTAAVSAALALVLLEGLWPRLCDAIVLPDGIAPWMSSNRPPSAHPVDRAWKGAAAELSRWGPADLVLVGSGLIEMQLVPAYRDDPTFHDYVSCRLGRTYRQGDYLRLSVPMFWTADLSGFYRQAIARACRSKRPGEACTVWLVAATDTDLLQESGEQAESIIKGAGGVERYRSDKPGATCVMYLIPARD